MKRPAHGGRNRDGVSRTILASTVAALAMITSLTPAKAQPKLTVTAVGTSLTHEAGWSAPLRSALESCGLGPVEVLEIAGAGENSYWGVTQTAAIARSQPDVLLIEFSANDARLWGGVSMQDSRSNVMTMVAAARQTRPDVRVILMAMNPSWGTRSWIRPWLDAYYDDYQALALAAGFGFVDHRPAWRAMGEETLSQAIPDGIHPSADAAASVIVPALVAAIAGRPC